jgi:hypothetical protein
MPDGSYDSKCVSAAKPYTLYSEVLRHTETNLPFKVAISCPEADPTYGITVKTLFKSFLFIEIEAMLI